MYNYAPLQFFLGLFGRILNKLGKRVLTCGSCCFVDIHCCVFSVKQKYVCHCSEFCRIWEQELDIKDFKLISKPTFNAVLSLQFTIVSLFLSLPNYFQHSARVHHYRGRFAESCAV